MALFDRTYKLLIGDAGKPGIEIDTSLHIEFSVVKSDKADDNNKATIVIFNLSDESIATIDKDQKVILEAGYREDFSRTIFLGQITDVDSERIGPLVKTTIKCEDGYVPVRQGYTGRSFPAKTTVEQMITEIVTLDLELPKPTFSNGKLGDSKGINKHFQQCVTKVGHSGDVITALCKENFLTWSIREGNVTVYPVDGSTDLNILLLSEETGMLGSPQKATDNKNKTAKSKDLKTVYKVRSLLNGDFNIGKLIKVKSNFTNGIYRVIKVTHKGTFRGNDWFSDLVLAEGVGK